MNFRIQSSLCGSRKAFVLVLLVWLLPGGCKSRNTSEVIDVRATLIHIEGTIKVKRAKSTQWVSGAKNMKIGLNDKISSDTNSYATIQFESGAVVELDANSLIAIQDVTQKRKIVGARLTIDRGSVNIDATSDQEFRIKTPTAEAILDKREITYQ